MELKMEQNLQSKCELQEMMQQLEEQLQQSSNTESFYIIKQEPDAEETLLQKPAESIASASPNLIRIISDTEDSNFSSPESSSMKRKLPCLLKKSGSRYYKTKFDLAWMQLEPFKGVIVPVKNDASYFRCLICEKNVSCAHQGILDVKRHIAGKGHRALQDKKLRNKAIAGRLAEQQSTEDGIVQDAEIKFTTFLVQYNIPFSDANHLVRIIWKSFPDYTFAQSFDCDGIRACCVLNDIITPVLLSDLIAEIKSSVFSLFIDISAGQGTENKSSPLTVRIIDSKQGKVCCRFLDMCLSKLDTAEGVFMAVSNTMYKHSIPWENCVGFGVDNVSVALRKHNSVKTMVQNLNTNMYLMACPCNLAHSAASQASSAFCTVIKNFDVEDFLIDLHYWFDYSSKRINLPGMFCRFVDSDYRRVLKFLSVKWLGMTTCLDRLIQQFDDVRSYFLLTPDIKGASEFRLRRLVQCFEDPMTEIYCLFLQASLPAFVNFDLLLQREDPIIHVLYDAIIDLIALLLSRAFTNQVVQSFIKNPEACLLDLTLRDRQTLDSSLYVGIGVRGNLKTMLERRDIDLEKHNSFFKAVRQFHQAAVKYTLDCLPIHDQVLKHARVFNFFEKHKYGYESVLFMVERFNTYLKFNNQHLACLEQEFVAYQVIDFEELTIKAREEAAIKVNCSSGEVASYRMDIIWFHLERDFIVPGTQRSKFYLLSKIGKVLFTLPHSNADEERVFSRVSKNKAKFANERTLSSVLMLQTNRPHSE